MAQQHAVGRGLAVEGASAAGRCALEPSTPNWRRSKGRLCSLAPTSASAALRVTKNRLYETIDHLMIRGRSGSELSMTMSAASVGDAAAR